MLLLVAITEATTDAGGRPFRMNALGPAQPKTFIGSEVT